MSRSVFRCISGCAGDHPLDLDVGQDVEHQVELEGLADLGLMLHHAVVGVQRQSIDEHLIGHLMFRSAAATRSAWMVSATSWVRMMAAPFI